MHIQFYKTWQIKILLAHYLCKCNKIILFTYNLSKIIECSNSNYITCRAFRKTQNYYKPWKSDIYLHWRSFYVQFWDVSIVYPSCSGCNTVFREQMFSYINYTWLSAGRLLIFERRSKIKDRTKVRTVISVTSRNRRSHPTSSSPPIRVAARPRCQNHSKRPPFSESRSPKYLPSLAIALSTPRSFLLFLL